jgi:hypothetical protein
MAWVGLAGILARVDGLDAHLAHMSQYCFMIYHHPFFFLKPHRYPSVSELRVARVNAVYGRLHSQV